MRQLASPFNGAIVDSFAHIACWDVHLNETTMNRMMMEKTDGERFLQMLDDQFRLFALIVSISPQTLCRFHPIYY